MTIFVSNEELYSLLQSEENDTLDFKSADLLREPDGENRYKIAKHLVGFANHNGGKLVFGVNDDREPEGKELLEEKSLGTISEIISTQISPSIDFTYLYFSTDNNDLSQGTIFVVDVHQSSSPVPHAIIENSGGKIRKREYRIRAGESTRLVSNEELLALFKDHTNIDLKYSGSIHFLLDDDYLPAKTKYKPRYQYTFDRHFWELGSDDGTLIEKIKDGSSDHSDRAIERIIGAQYALTISTILSHPEFTFVSEKELADRINEPVDKLTFNIKSIEPSDIILNSDSNPLIDKTAMEKPGIFPEHDSRFDYFKIPESANVSIWEDFDGFDIHNDHFSLSFSIDLIEVGVGLPTPHPDSVPEPGEYGLIAQNRSNATMDSHITISSEFKYPNQDISEFESYRVYCESIIGIFERVFNWEEYVDNLPDTKLLKIEKMIEEIHEEIRELKEGQEK